MSQLFGAKNGTPPAPQPLPKPFPIGGGNSISGQNCTTNPDFCTANQVQLSMCDMGLGIGDTVVQNPTTKTKMFFKGQKIMAASLHKLASLGLAKAEKVILTGVATGGSMVYIHADAVHAAVKAIAPNLKVFKALPVDGFHPKLRQTLFCTAGIMKQNCGGSFSNGTIIDSWYTGALKSIVNMSKASAALSAPCKADHQSTGDEFLCLYANETLPYIQTPIFAVQQLVSVWDAQCMYEGQAYGGILQVACSQRGNYFRDQYTCVQYPDLCNAQIVSDWWAPAQQQYLDDYTHSGAHARPGNGGFFHQCYLGSYFQQSFGSTDQSKVPRATTGVWNEIAVDGLTMQQAISKWWNGAATEPGPFLHDVPWNPSGTPPTGVGQSGTRDGAPVVPWYTARWMSNPTCRGYPWY